MLLFFEIYLGIRGIGMIKTADTVYIEDSVRFNSNSLALEDYSYLS